MTPVEILMSEHRVIEQMLNCVEKMGAGCVAARKLDRRDATEALDFLGRFADGCHHGKEEKYLFPMLESKGIPRNGGPVGVMLEEHDLGRLHIRQMKAALEKACAGDAEALRKFQDNALAYAQLLRQHIQKEDQILFQMADQVMTVREQEAMVADFTRVESEDIGAGVHERYLKLADDLAARLGVPKATVGAGHGGGFS